jgi:hypothetical protein
VAPESLNPDPDPAFQENPDPIRIQGFDDQKLKEKNTVENFLSCFDQKLQFFMSKLQEKPKREHPALQKKKFINYFLCLWAIFALLDPCPDPGIPLNPDQGYLDASYVLLRL